MQQRYSAVRQLSIRFHPLGNPRDGENIQLFVCALLLVEDITGTSFLPGEKSDLRFKFSMRSLTRKSPLEMFSEYQGSNTVYLEWSRCTLQSTFTNNPLTLVLTWDSKGEWRGVQTGGWRKVRGRCFVTIVQTGQMKFYCLGNYHLPHLPLWPQITSKQSFLHGSWCFT